jgi:hypothetical protein
MPLQRVRQLTVRHVLRILWARRDDKGRVSLPQRRQTRPPLTLAEVLLRRNWPRWRIAEYLAEAAARGRAPPRKGGKRG